MQLSLVQPLSSPALSPRPQHHPHLSRPPLHFPASPPRSNGTPAACSLPASHDYFIAPSKRGFLPSTDPACFDLKTVSPQNETWDQVALNFPDLLAAYSAAKVRQIIEKLPPFDCQQLIREGESGYLWKAMLVVSFVAHAYVWCGEVPAYKLPDNIAKPWRAIARRLDVPPIISYGSLLLSNWRRVEKTLPVGLENMACCYNFSGTVDEEWFYLVHADVEAKGAPLAGVIIRAQEAVLDMDVPMVKESLALLAGTSRLMSQSLQRMEEKCDPYTFYHKFRKFMAGWRNNPQLPQGSIVYGVDNLSFYGASGAQSTVIPALDAALGIHHSDGSLNTFLQVMRSYMPSSHRQYLKLVETGPSIRDFVKQNPQELAQEYDQCIREVFKFRSVHIGLSQTYIKKSSKQDVKEGTGGSDFVTYLVQNASNTVAHSIGSPT